MQVEGLDQQGEHHKVHCDLAQRQQVQGGIVGLICTGRKVHQNRAEEVGGKAGDMEDVQQHDEQAGDAGVCHPQDGSREAEHEIQRLGDRGQRSGKGQRHQNGSGLFTVLLAGAEDKGRHDAKVAEGLGEAGVHPHNAVREGQTHAVLHHHYDVGAGVGGIAHGQAVAQCRELEGGVNEVVQAGGDEEALQKAVQEQAEVAGGGDQIGQCADDILHRRPEEAGTKAEQDGKDHHAGKGPAVAGVDLGDDALELLFTGAVVHPAADKTQQDAAEHAHIHRLDAEHGGLTGAVQTHHRISLGQHAQLGQRDVAGGQVHKVAHQADDGSLLLVLFGKRRCDAHAEHQAEVVDDDHDAVVDQLSQQLDRGPLQNGDHRAKACAGKQCAQHKDQACCRDIRQR